MASHKIRLSRVSRDAMRDLLRGAVTTIGAAKKKPGRSTRTGGAGRPHRR
jgi:hypothetical protein